MHGAQCGWKRAWSVGMCVGALAASVLGTSVANAVSLPHITVLLRVNGSHLSATVSGGQTVALTATETGLHSATIVVFQRYTNLDHKPASRFAGKCQGVASSGHCHVAPQVRDLDGTGETTFFAAVSWADAAGHAHVTRSNDVTIKVLQDKPSYLTVEAGGATRGADLITGALTCEGSGYNLGTSCYVDVPEDSDVPVVVKADVAMPSGWKLQFVYDSPLSGEQVLCESEAMDCEFTVHVGKAGTPSGIAMAKIVNPDGYWSVALYLSPAAPSPSQ